MLRKPRDPHISRQAAEKARQYCLVPTGYDSLTLAIRIPEILADFYKNQRTSDRGILWLLGLKYALQNGLFTQGRLTMSPQEVKAICEEITAN